MPLSRADEPNNLHRSTLLLLMLAIWLSYPLAILLVGPEKAIEIGNVVLFSLSCGITVTYSPDAVRAFRYRLIDGGSILAVGILASWLGVATARGTSIAWRILDQPVDWLNSGWWGTHIAFSATGAMCHLIAPQAVSGRVPAKHLLKIGMAVAVSVFIASMLAMLNFT